MNVNFVALPSARTGAGLSPAQSAAAAGGDSFSTLLDREQARPLDEESPEEGPQAVDRRAAQRKAREARADARAADRPAATERPDDPHETQAHGDQADDQDADGLLAPDASLMHWLQHLDLPPAPPGGIAPDGPGAVGGRTTAGDDGTATTKTAGRGAARMAADAGHDPAAGQDDDIAQDPMSATESAALQADTEVATARPEGSPRFADALAAVRSGSTDAATATPSIAATTATSATSATASTAAAGAPAQVELPVPLDDPQFPRAFGVRVSVLARDGVQRAELHLNPAEMGPVSVQIVMEGTQARIDFGADAAQTRALIERSLPELAAALREAGLTLAGGGVSQHAGQGREPGAPAASTSDVTNRTEARPEATGEPRVLRRTVTAGGVDLYA